MPQTAGHSRLAGADLEWMLNFSIEGQWRFIPVRLVVQGLLPRQLFESGCLFSLQVTNLEGEPLLQSAVREGTWISLANLKLICRRLEVEPPKGSGSGEKGEIWKVDWAKHLVNYLFPDSPAEEKQRMVASLTWRGHVTSLGDKEKDILEMVAELDAENADAPEFRRVAKLAKEKMQEEQQNEVASETRKLVEAEFKRMEVEEKERVERARLEAERAATEAVERELAVGASATASGSRKASATPPSLRQFLTSDMVSEKISLNRDESGYGYRAYYPSFFANKSLVLFSCCFFKSECRTHILINVLEFGTTFYPQVGIASASFYDRN